MVAVDAPRAAPPGARGDWCKADSCGEGLGCGPLPGGYCLSFCAGGTACDGACVEATRLPDVCMKRCTTDADCRKDAGYVCDAQWRACLIPNFAAIVPKQCPTRTPARDTTFAGSEPWSTSANPSVDQRNPSAVLTSDGGVVALYEHRSPRELGLSRIDGKGQRTIDQQLATPRSSHPWLARDRKDALHAVWKSDRQILYATTTDRGATWSTPIAVHDPADCTDEACVDDPMVVIGVDPKTKTELVHVMYAAGENGLRVRTSRDGAKTFTQGPLALIGTYGNAIATADGKLHIVTLKGSWRGAYGAASHDIEYTVSSDGGATFARPVRASAYNEMLPYFFSNPSLAIDSKRKLLYVAYASGGRDAKWDIVLAVSKDAGESWKRTKLAGDNCAMHMVPNVAVDPTTGRVHVAYYDTEGAVGRFTRASCAAGGKQCAVHGAINSVPFVTLSMSRYSSKSVGDSQALLVDDKRRSLHAVWAQPVDESGKTLTRIFHAVAKLPKR